MGYTNIDDRILDIIDRLQLPDNKLELPKSDYCDMLYLYLCDCIENNNFYIVKNILESIKHDEYTFKLYLYSNDELILRLTYLDGNIKLFKYLIDIYNNDAYVNDLYIIYSAYKGKIKFIKHFIKMFKDKINKNTIENIIKYLFKSHDDKSIEYSKFLIDEYSDKINININNIIINIDVNSKWIDYVKYLIDKYNNKITIDTIKHVITRAHDSVSCKYDIEFIKYLIDKYNDEINIDIIENIITYLNRYGYKVNINKIKHTLNYLQKFKDININDYEKYLFNKYSCLYV